MKNKYLFSAILAVTTAIGLGSACSSNPISPGTQGKDLAANGPTIIDTKTNPSTFEVNRELKPTTGAQVIADVKDLTGKVKSVKLRFEHAPIELSMQQMNSSAWEADLTPAQLKQLAVSGHTMKYQADVIATNDKGYVAVSKEPVQIQVKAQEVGNG